MLINWPSKMKQRRILTASKKAILLLKITKRAIEGLAGEMVKGVLASIRTIQTGLNMRLGSAWFVFPNYIVFSWLLGKRCKLNCCIVMDGINLPN